MTDAHPPGPAPTSAAGPAGAFAPGPAVLPAPTASFGAILRGWGRWGVQELPYLGVLLLGGLGIVYAVIFSEHWLRGVGVVGVSLLVAGLLRASLDDRHAGLLVVRQRPFDVACYLALGGAIIGVGLVLPH